ncbi:hypothetical protein AB205_0086890, partial [Aquarana catesbeiana]
GEDLVDIKFEVKEEERYVRDDQQSMEEDGITGTFIEEDTPTEISTDGQEMRKTSEDCLTLSPDCKEEDEDIKQYSPGEDLCTRNVHPESHSVDEPSYYREEPQTERDGAVLPTDRNVFNESLVLPNIREPTQPLRCIRCPECDGQEMRKTSEDCLTLSPDCKEEDEDIKQYSPGEDLCTRNVHPESHSVDEPSYYREEPQTERDGAVLPTDSKVEDEDITQYSPGEDLFTRNTVRDGAGPSYSSYPEEPQTVRDGAGPSYSSYPEEPQTVRDGAILPTFKRFPCTECGKCFRFKSGLNEHKRSHTGEKPYSCPECGKYFSRKSNLYTHQRSHRGLNPFTCSECGTCFLHKPDLIKHQRSHMGEKLYSCSECGKCFRVKSCLHRHQKSHTGKKPYSCPECGKCFSQKCHLSKHQKSHTGEKPYSCPECGKCYSQ